ncbi:MAG: DUF1549 domain-containing protein [Planctomycetaceae bacterium]|nr:DUF1549 domain-containing protein [Planctomycetaceae bacterium]
MPALAEACRMVTRLTLTVCLLSVCASALLAAELPSPDLPIQAVIDTAIRDDLAAKSIIPATPATDAALLRRTTLDLAGRIPTLTELADFEKQSPSEKREKLVDRLLDSPDFALHQRNEWDSLLLPSTRESSNEWREYLLKAALENRPWDQMFADMLAAKDDDIERRGALQFVKARARDLDDLTNDTSVLFFGVNVSCAKCHDHPLVDDWKQDHFYGMTSFFARTYVTRSRRVAEKSYAEVKFKTTKGVEKTGNLMFLTGALVNEPALELTKEQRKAEDDAVRKAMQEEKADLPATPSFSPRWELVQLALQPENRPFLARAAVNRIWARFMGRGLVHPLDQLHSSNAASHPALLDWLERDFVNHGYDWKRLVRGIVLSEAYARSSEWTASTSVPESSIYAVAAIRPLTPRQLGLSLQLAVSNPASYETVLDAAKWSPSRNNLENAGNGWAGNFEQPTEHFQVSATESLFFSNAERVQNDLLRDSSDRLVGVVKMQTDRDAGIQIAYRVVLSRAPSEEELNAFRGFLTQRENRSVAGWQQAVWALITSPEFRFNY